MYTIFMYTNDSKDVNFSKYLKFAYHTPFWAALIAPYY